MKILRKYILKELFLPAVLCLVILNFIFMAGYLVRAANFIIGRGVPLFDTLTVLLLALPDMISYTAPMSLLTAVMLVYGGPSQNNEIRAMKASGIHPVAIMLPALLLGVALSFFMLFFNDQIGNEAGFKLRKMTKQMVVKHPHAMIEPGRFVKLSENLIFFTKELNDNKLKDVVVYETEDSEKPIRTVLAEKGEIISNPDHTEITIRLFNGSVSDAEQQEVHAIQFQTYEFPTIMQNDIKNMRKKVREHSLAELLVKMSDPNLNERDKMELSTSYHYRIAFSLGNFLFVLIGIPVAFLVRRGEIIISFAMAMGMACLYYILFVGARTVAYNELLSPAIACWFPNILLLAVGAYLTRKAIIS